MDVNKLLQVSAFAGQILLESGAETYRVEETIDKICLALELKKQIALQLLLVLLYLLLIKNKSIQL